MTVLTPDRVLLLLMAAAVIAGTVLRPGPAEYLAILLVCVFAAVYRLTRNRPDRLFYLACSGALLVAVCATASTWEGLFVAWMIYLFPVTGLGNNYRPDLSNPFEWDRPQKDKALH